MDSAKRCRDQSAECLRSMNLAQSETEARLLRDIGQSWVRIANQIERYDDFITRSGQRGRSVGMQNTNGRGYTRAAKNHSEPENSLVPDQSGARQVIRLR